MSEVILFIIGLSLGLFCGKVVNRKKKELPIENIIYSQVPKLKESSSNVEFLPEPDNKILQDIKDQETGMSEFMKDIEKPSDDEK